MNKNYKIFRKKLSGLVSKHKGKFVAVKNGHILGPYKSFSEACLNAYTSSGSEDFIVEQCLDDNSIKKVMHYAMPF